MKKPNLLFVFSDQHRFSDLGCYGNPQILSPHLDAFAKKSLRFTNCISNSPLCVPMRGSLLTGLYPWHHGAAANDLPLKKGLEGIGEVFQRGGYHTGYIGKWHLGGIPRDKAIAKEDRLGFDEWKTYNCHHDYLSGWYDDEQNVRRKFGKTTAEAETDFAIDFIERNSQSSDKPWSLHLSWGPPHDPYRDVPKEYLDLYDAETIQLRQNVTFPVMNTLSKFWDEKTLRNFLQGYYAQITFLDAQFGRLIACLEKSGELENTIVVYTSDHGDMLGSHALTHKQLPYAESCRVPLMVSWPGKITPTVTDDVVGLVDLPVTMAGLLDLQFKSSVDGFDFSGNWKKKADSQSIKPESALIMSLIPCHQAAGRGDSEWFGIKTKHYTFVINAEGRTTHLYDDVGDPFQQINLAGDPAFAKVASEIKKDMIAKAKKHGLTFKPFPEFVKEFGLTDLWNESQRYFNLPELD